MDYKALEDLIGILVKKAGTNLAEEMVSSEVLRLEEKKKKLVKDKSKFASMLSNKEYTDVLSREKDENEKQYLTKLISELEKKLQSLNVELESFNRVMESGETYYDTLCLELCHLQEDLKKLEIKIAMNNGNDELKVKLNELRESVDEKTNSLMRKKSLDEEIVRVLSEIDCTKESLKVVTTRIEMSSYNNNLDKINDQGTLESLEEEIKLLEKALEVWKSHPQILGGKILDAFKSKESIDSVKTEIDALIAMANEELKRTQEEINGSNIFELMDKYERLVSELQETVSSSTYDDESGKESVSVRERYHQDKVVKNKSSLAGIETRRAEVLDLISVSKKLCEEVKQSRMAMEAELAVLENKLFLENTCGVSDEDLRSIDKLIGDIKKDIEDYKLLEARYVEDVYSYKEEIKNLDINYSTLEKEIEEEDKLIGVITSRLNGNGIFVDVLRMLEDKLDLIKYKNRVDSLKYQQQYLYVDSKVIKDEINHLWKRSEGNTDEEVSDKDEYEEKVKESEETSNKDGYEEKVDESEVQEEIISDEVNEKVEELETDENNEVVEEVIEVIDDLEN